MAELHPGARFGGDFTILRVLGAGGMATVYEAREEPIGRAVALKVLDRAEPVLRARFLAEARTMAGLRHPGVAEVLRFGTDPATDLPFLATRPYPGSLADRLGDSRALGEADAAALGLRLADALAALHAADPPVVHRDVKPSNVLLDETGAPVLADFGVAKRLAPEETLHTLSSAGTQPGTLAYAAPEQRAGLPLGPAADWYAFGVLLYRCLTGGFPPPGGSLPVDVAAEVSRAWRPLLRGLLRDDPAARLADPGAIRAALRRVLRSCRRRSLLRRLRAPLALAAAALLALVAWRLSVSAGPGAGRAEPAESEAAPVPEWSEDGEPPLWPSYDSSSRTWRNRHFDLSDLERVAVPPEIDGNGVARVGPNRTVLSRDLPRDGSVREVVLNGGQLVFYDPDRADEPEHFPLPVRVTPAGGYLRSSDRSRMRYVTNSIAGGGVLNLWDVVVDSDSISRETRLQGVYRRAYFNAEGRPSRITSYSYHE